MKKRKKGLILGSLVAVALILVSCGTKEKKATTSEPSMSHPQEPKLNLSFGTMPATDALPIYIADHEGYFEEEDVTVDIQNFKSPKDRDAALSSGHLDGVSTDMIAFSTYLEGGLNIRLTSEANGYFSLLSGDDSVTTLAQLKGHSVSYFKNQAPHYFLDEAMKTVDLTADDLDLQEVPQVPVRVELVKNKQTTAAIVPDPFRTIGMKDGLTELAKSDSLNIKPNAFAFTEKTIQTNSEGIKAFYRAYNKGVDYIQQHKVSEYYPILEKQIGYSKEIESSVKIPTYVHAAPINEKQLDNALAWSKAKGIYTKEWTFSDLTSSVAFH